MQTEVIELTKPTVKEQLDHINQLKDVAEGQIIGLQEALSKGNNQWIKDRIVQLQKEVDIYDQILHSVWAYNDLSK